MDRSEYMYDPDKGHIVLTYDETQAFREEFNFQLITDPPYVFWEFRKIINRIFATENQFLDFLELNFFKP